MIAISTGILSALKKSIPQGGVPSNYAPEIRDFVEKNIKTHDPESPFPVERKTQLIKALSDALIDYLKPFDGKEIAKQAQDLAVQYLHGNNASFLQVA